MKIKSKPKQIYLVLGPERSLDLTLSELGLILHPIDDNEALFN